MPAGSRTAVIVVPGDAPRPAPLVFASMAMVGRDGHGAQVEHRGTVAGRDVVYPDGLVGHKGKTDPEGVRTGWRLQLGEDGDRDPCSTTRCWAVSGRSYPSTRIAPTSWDTPTGLRLRRSPEPAGRRDWRPLTCPRTVRSASSRATRHASMFMAMGTGDAGGALRHQSGAPSSPSRRLGSTRTTSVTVTDTCAGARTWGLELQTYIYPGGHAPPPEVPKLVVDFFQRLHAVLAADRHSLSAMAALDGKVALITGAASGIGAADMSALTKKAPGVHVDLAEDGGRAVAKSVGGVFHRADVGELHEVDAGAHERRTRSRRHRLRALNAGIAIGHSTDRDAAWTTCTG